jgi:hypothetical protein
MSSPKRLARIAGLLYLIVGIFGGLAVGYATPKVYVAGDAATTAENVLANSGLVRFIAQIFFGLWLVPLGYLAYTSGLFPKALGVVLIVGGVSYLVDMLAAFLVPDFGTQIHGFLAIPPTIAEIWMLGYLLVKGVKVPAQGTPIVRAGKTSRMLGEEFP